MTAAPNDWLAISRGDAPLILSIPHSGTEIPAEIAHQLRDDWLARKDADWWLHLLYDFASDLDVTVVRTTLSRTVIDTNRRPDGESLYPGQATTELCPTTTFDGEPLYLPGSVPDAAEVERRRTRYFEPYHAALRAEIERLRARHRTVVLYEAHSIRSRVPRLFDGVLPQFNLGTNRGASCAPELARSIEATYAGSGHTHVTDGRFQGGYTTRHYGRTDKAVHAVQMELACRGYLDEPNEPLNKQNWPPAYDPARARPLREVLTLVLAACIDFAAARARPGDS